MDKDNQIIEENELRVREDLIWYCV